MTTARDMESCKSLVEAMLRKHPYAVGDKAYFMMVFMREVYHVEALKDYAIARQANPKAVYSLAAIYRTRRLVRLKTYGIRYRPKVKGGPLGIPDGDGIRIPPEVTMNVKAYLEKAQSYRDYDERLVHHYMRRHHPEYLTFEKIFNAKIVIADPESIVRTRQYFQKTKKKYLPSPEIRSSREAEEDLYTDYMPQGKH